MLFRSSNNLLSDFHSGNIQSYQQINPYKLRVQFNDIIGKYLSEGGTQGIDTSVGIIHNGKNGAHIVPAKPKINSNNTTSNE